MHDQGVVLPAVHALVLVIQRLQRIHVGLVGRVHNSLEVGVAAGRLGHPHGGAHDHQQPHTPWNGALADAIQEPQAEPPFPAPRLQEARSEAQTLRVSEVIYRHLQIHDVKMRADLRSGWCNSDPANPNGQTL